MSITQRNAHIKEDHLNQRKVLIQVGMSKARSWKTSCLSETSQTREKTKTVHCFMLDMPGKAPPCYTKCEKSGKWNLSLRDEFLHI